MGCVESRSEANDVQATVFQVESFDEHGQRHRSVRLEVTDSNLVLHNKNKTAIRWPLRCLRRYGFDGETFTFESGRRCPTGPGIYTYRCRRAQDLFNMLQLKIQKIAEQSVPQELPALLPDDYVNPIVVNNRIRSDSILLSGSANMQPGGVVLAAAHPVAVSSFIPAVPQTLMGSNSITSPVASPHTPISPANGTFYINNPVLSHENLNEVERGSSAPPSTPARDDRGESFGAVWLNCNERSATFVNSNDRPISQPSSISDRLVSSLPMNHVDRPLSFAGHTPDPYNTGHHSALSEPYDHNSLARTPDIVDSANHVYMNIGSDNRRDLDRLYANMGFDKDIPVVPPRLSITTGGSAGSGSSHSGTTTTDTTQPNSQVNYIIIDIDKGSDSSQVPPFSPIGSITSGLPESPPTRTASGRYATIDFERTEALTNTAKMANCHANGGRHNSTFSGIINLPHHHSSYSE